MYRIVTVIGLGTLGGFLCKHLSEMESIKELTIVDHDIVEGRNVFKSVYAAENVGEYKVDALYNIIEKDVTVTKINTQYVEGKTILPSSDLVIDCRDVVCDRSKEIDIRFFISERILMIDCRKNVRNRCDYEGAYRIQLNKSEINTAAFFATQTIVSGQLKDMINNNMVQRINLNLISSVMDNSIRRTLNNKLDIIYELADNAQRLQCIEENIRPILKLNKKSDVEVFVGERIKQSNKVIKMPQLSKTKYALIPKNSLTNSFDVIQALTDIVKTQPGIMNFIVTIRKDNFDFPFIELVEETGAA